VREGRYGTEVTASRSSPLARHISAGSKSTELGCLVDLMGTLAEIIDYRLPGNAGEDTTAARPVGQERKPIREAVCTIRTSGFRHTQGDWKLELGLGSGGFSDPRQVDPVPEVLKDSFTIWL
jgi:hypothetical protein